MMKRILTGLVISVAMAGLAMAGPPELARMYADGAYAFQRCDFARAVQLRREAGQRGNADAQYSLGQIYEVGQYVPSDYAEAAKWYGLAAAQGFPAAIEKRGPDGSTRLNPPGSIAPASQDDLHAAQTASVRQFRPLAEQGQAEAQEKLGYMYSMGYGVAQNTAEAVSWWIKAAEQGNATAQWSLGLAYSCGEVSVPTNFGEAAKWLQRAAGHGFAAAQNSLGETYRDGKGVPKDYALAHMWFNLAAAKDNADAAKSRDDLEQNMPPDQIAEAQRLAREWKPTAGN